MKLAVVTWNDAHAETTTWLPMEATDQTEYEVISLGVLLDESQGKKEKHLSLAMSVSCDAFMDCVLHIPEAMVVDVYVIGEAEIKDGKIVVDKKRSKHRSTVSEKSRRQRST